MIVRSLELVDFRNYRSATFELTAGVTAVIGRNGQGKTNFAEALAYLATLDSFRGAPPEALIRVGAEVAIIRATIVHDDGREVLIEAEISRTGRNRVQVNRQRLVRVRELLGSVRVSVFAPDDLALVKGAPSERRRFLDGALVALAVKYDAMRLELDRIVKQRNTLLKQLAARTGGARTDVARTDVARTDVARTDVARTDVEGLHTLDVWDAKLAETGDRFGHARAVLVARMAPHVVEAYEQLAAAAVAIDLVYEPPWRSTGLASALAAARDLDIRRATSTVGPHRDELELRLAGMPARTHASQGEQRTLALAMRLGAHRLVADTTGTPPVLVLDDVLSELDADRATALLQHIPPGQVVLTTASELPPAARPDVTLRIEDGHLGDAATVAQRASS